MRRPFSLKPKEEYEFIVGQTDRFLIMRNLTANIVLRSDTFENDLTLSRSDTVTVETLERVKMKFVNTSDVVISGEFQLSPVEIRIKEQRMNVENAITIDEILRPVVIEKINQVVTAKLSEPVDVGNVLSPVLIKNEPINYSKVLFIGHEKAEAKDPKYLSCIVSGDESTSCVISFETEDGNHFELELSAGDMIDYPRGVKASVSVNLINPNPLSKVFLQMEA
ncbi:hypothetical protein C5F63_06050 [Photobacterium damselae subsp. damselae]|uniref:hypothetical protein n=1 Tax=Photobacterium damselae TaxID=38293 RepID=UPI000D0672FA|nr:hypothetical protein [Photobacterium damselae]PSB89070.1 hypothetical protein C5F63_06050 [Photobacterium damselae subsp. damselae]